METKEPILDLSYIELLKDELDKDIFPLELKKIISNFYSSHKVLLINLSKITNNIQESRKSIEKETKEELGWLSNTPIGKEINFLFRDMDNLSTFQREEVDSLLRLMDEITDLYNDEKAENEALKRKLEFKK